MSIQSEKHIVGLVDKAIKQYHGDARKLSNAIGYLMIGRKIGWRPSLLMYDRKSIREYERILGGMDSKDYMPEVGPLADKSLGWRLVQKVTNFWKAVKGETPGYRSTQLE